MSEKVGSLKRYMSLVSTIMETGQIKKKDYIAKNRISERTAQRDFSMLATEGIPDIGIITLAYDHFIDAHRPDEASLERIRAWRMRKALDLKKSMPDEKERKKTGLDNRILYDSAYIIHKSYAVEYFDTRIYVLLMDAIQKRRCVRFHMKNRTKKTLYPDEDGFEHVRPLRLVVYGELWYLWGMYENDYKKKRRIYTFNLSRITDLEMTGEQDTSDFEAEKAIKSNLRLITENYGIWYDTNNTGSKKYVVRFFGSAAQNVYPQTWQKEQELTWEDEEKTVLRMEIPVVNDFELIGRLMLYGKNVEPVSPPEFVEHYKSACFEMAERYRDEYPEWKKDKERKKAGRNGERKAAAYEGNKDE